MVILRVFSITKLSKGSGSKPSCNEVCRPIVTETVNGDDVTFELWCLWFGLTFHEALSSWSSITLMIGISHCEESSSHCGFLDLHFSSFSICPFILLFHYYTSDELKSRITGYCQFQKCLLSLFRSVPNVFSRWNVSTAERPVLYFLLPCWYSCTLQFSIVMPKYATPEEDVYFDKSLKALIEVDIFFSRHLLWSRHLLQVSLNHLKHFLLQVESSHTLVRPFICAFFF